MTAPHRLDATTALQLFRRGELSPVELLDDIVERIDTVGPAVNALTETLFVEARRAAQDAADAYVHGGVTGALTGIPVAAKEKHGLAGRTLSQGLVAYKSTVADRDHPVIERIRAAGGIVHARTTSPEFSCATVTHSPLWGVTRNPWNLEKSPGGSSGGSGAALAAGLAPLATASDIAGSTRLPASFTGTVGYKAPYGAVPGLPPLSLDHYRGDGPMARTVNDVALLNSVLAGPDARDHSTVPAPPDHVPRPDVQGRRIALCVRLGDYPVTGDVERNTRAVADALTDLGAVVEEVELPWTTERISRTIFAHFGHILGPAMAEVTAGHEDELADYTLRFMADARSGAAGWTFYDTLAAESRIHDELATAMAGVDALICPASATPALDADASYLDGIDVGGVHLEHYWQAHMTAPFNIANRCPVLAVPSGMADCGIPTGVQIVGHPYDGATVFDIGAAIEVARPWPVIAPL